MARRRRLTALMRVAPALAVSGDTPGPTTWRFRLRPGGRFQDGQASTSLLLNRLAFIAIVPRSSPDEIRAPAGTGPYRLDPAGLPGELTLRRSDVYWGRRPAEPIVWLRVVPDHGRTRAMLLAGDGRILAADLGREPGRVP